MCSLTLLSFLLNYPLGPKRLSQHLLLLPSLLTPFSFHDRHSHHCTSPPRPPPSTLHRSQSPNVRTMCSVTLLSFLLDYPLGPKRLSQHLGFLAANLSYEHESGRLAVLETLQLVGGAFRGFIS